MCERGAEHCGKSGSETFLTGGGAIFRGAGKEARTCDARKLTWKFRPFHWPTEADTKFGDNI